MGEDYMPEITKNYIRIPVKRKRKNNELRTITLGKGVKALYDIKRKIIVTYLFDKTKYTLKEAKEWVKKHTSNAALELAVKNLILANELKLSLKNIENEVITRLNEKEKDL